MSKTNTSISLTDDAATAEHDDDTKLSDADLGNDGSGDGEEEEEEEQLEKVAKKATKKVTKKTVIEESEEEEEGEEEEEEEEPAADPEKTKLAKKLARAGRAREALENQLSELRKQVETQTEQRSEASQKRLDVLMKELDDLYESVEELRAEGKTGEAAKAQRRIDAIRDGMTRSQATVMASREALKQTEVRAYNTMVSELEVIDPRFDVDHDDYDPGLLEDLSEMVEGYEAKGMMLTEALRKAAKLILRDDVFSKGYTAKLKRDEPKKPADKKTDVKANLKAAKKQPPDEPGVRKEKATELPDMATISEKDFDALPESVQQRLLGNV